MSSFWDKQTTIAEVEKNKREKIIATECERQGKKYLDLRINVDHDGNYIPTAKGFNLEVDKAKVLLEEIKNKI